MSSTTTSIWVVTAEFTERDDAVALMDLARELGIVTQISSRSINEYHRSAARDTRLGKLILRAFVDPSRTYDLEYMAAACEEGGYKGNSASPVLSKLVDQGDVERLTGGLFRLKSPAT